MIPPTDHVTLAMALLAGLLGSGHCLAMCGGIACLPAAAGGNKPVRLLLFNLGRVLSYSILGALAATLGAGLLKLLAGPVAPSVLRLAAALMVAVVAAHLLWPARVGMPGQRVGRWAWRRLSPLVKPLVGDSSVIAALLLGAVWGWLPCGLVYAMLGAAAVAGSPAGGAATMAAFGLGTLPAMLVTGAAGGSLIGFIRNSQLRLWAGGLLLVAAAWTAWMPITHLWPGEAPAHHHHQSMAEQEKLPDEAGSG